MVLKLHFRTVFCALSVLSFFAFQNWILLPLFCVSKDPRHDGQEIQENHSELLTTHVQTYRRNLRGHMPCFFMTQVTHSHTYCMS